MGYGGGFGYGGGYGGGFGYGGGYGQQTLDTGDVETAYDDFKHATQHDIRPTSLKRPLF
jgi:hypothetical protein